jgi:CheY-like chemotaxis protein
LKPGPHVCLRVRDNGHGMDALTVERVFEPFFTTKGLERGTGLGLSSVYGIVEQSGGLVSLESALGEGSSFCVYLPRVARRSAVAAADRVRSEVRARSGTVLLVEDDPALRRLLRRTLAAQRHDVLEAANGMEALEIAKRHDGKIDVVITDVVMPRGGGRELAEQILKSHPEASVIFMTGYTDDAVLLRGVFAQEVKLLRKPFLLRDLSAALAEVLGSLDER